MSYQYYTDFMLDPEYQDAMEHLCPTHLHHSRDKFRELIRYWKIWHNAKDQAKAIGRKLDEIKIRLERARNANNQVFVRMWAIDKAHYKHIYKMYAAYLEARKITIEEDLLPHAKPAMDYVYRRWLDLAREWQPQQ